MSGAPCEIHSLIPPPSSSRRRTNRRTLRWISPMPSEASPTLRRSAP
ncbi:MAG: hypothetical protein ACHQ3O_02840 [Candidatus Limnocylindria bacterium]